MNVPGREEVLRHQSGSAERLGAPPLGVGCLAVLRPAPCEVEEGGNRGVIPAIIWREPSGIALGSADLPIGILRGTGRGAPPSCTPLEDLWWESACGRL